jgi:hypothetical protein
MGQRVKISGTMKLDVMPIGADGKPAGAPIPDLSKRGSISGLSSHDFREGNKKLLKVVEEAARTSPHFGEDWNPGAKEGEEFIAVLTLDSTLEDGLPGPLTTVTTARWLDSVDVAELLKMLAKAK